MKAFSLITLLLLSNISLQAKEIFAVDDRMDGPITNPFLQGRGLASATEDVINVQTHMKITQLERELEIQKVNYEKKIQYLQEELRKSQKTLVERSLNQIKKDKMASSAQLKEKHEIKRELASTNSKIQEYQRLLTAVAPSNDMKLLIESNTKLAAELRKATNELAHPNLKKSKNAEAIAIKDLPNFNGRFPANAPDLDKK